MQCSQGAVGSSSSAFLNCATNRRTVPQPGSSNRKTTRHLGRTTARGDRKARANARSLHRLSQFLARERSACAGTVCAAKPATGPLNTYNGWLERKRQVRKGEKGITLCMPMACKRNPQTEAVQEETSEPQTCCAFRFGRIGLCSRRPRGKTL